MVNSRLLVMILVTVLLLQVSRWCFCCCSFFSLMFSLSLSLSAFTTTELEASANSYYTIASAFALLGGFVCGLTRTYVLDKCSLFFTSIWVFHRLTWKATPDEFSSLESPSILSPVKIHCRCLPINCQSCKTLPMNITLRESAFVRLRVENRYQLLVHSQKLGWSMERSTWNFCPLRAQLERQKITLTTRRRVDKIGYKV